MTSSRPLNATAPFAHMFAAAGRIRMLASVATAGEAALAVAGGADIIDAKAPAHGALGALDTRTLCAIRRAVPATIPMSATTGDIPVGEVARIVNEIQRVAATGADAVKIGLFAPGNAARLLDRLTALDDDAHAYGRRVAVLLADRDPDWDIIAALPAAGFSGVMLDTADKASGSLLDVLPRARIASFLSDARGLGLFAGLAGALRLRHIPVVMSLGPDVVGFRGALCRDLERTASIDQNAVCEVRTVLAGGKADAAASPLAALPGQ